MVVRNKQKIKHQKTSLGKPSINIGKKGPTLMIIKEISKNLEAKKSVKVKLLK